VGDVDPEEIEDLINELEDLSDSGPDVDTISVGSTPKPSLRYLLTYLGYLVVDLRWSRWVLSGDVVSQCCLRTCLSSV
jgi:hypothetical protein